MVTRRGFLKGVGAGLAGLGFAGALHGREKAKNQTRPNFVIFIADDVGWNDVGVYGNSGVRTPNIDRMAAEGMKFENAFLTCASCSPTRCSIMTGRYPHNTGAKELHQPLLADQVVFAGVLKDAGYHTVSAGKWHLGNAARANFDKIVGGGASGCDQWVNVLKDRPKDKPFFIWMAGVDAHRPYRKGILDKPHGPDDVTVPPFWPDTPEVRDDLAMYYDEITRFDDYVGKVLAELERQGVAENTFCLFISDNGRPFPRCKTTVYDSGVRTPFVVRWPGEVDKGVVSESLVSVIDIAPTVVELAGVKVPDAFQGRSFAKTLRRPSEEIRHFVFSEHNWHDYKAHERAVRSKKWLYIRNAFPQLPATPPADAVRSPTYTVMKKLRDRNKLTEQQMACFIAPRPKEELYDVVADPFQMNNLANDEQYADALEKMSRVLDEWIIETEDKVDGNPTPDRFDRETGQRIK